MPEISPRAVFALASGRSGTAFLCGLLRANARGVAAEHETYFRRGNPSMFGRPIYDLAAGDLEAVRRSRCLPACARTLLVPRFASKAWSTGREVPGSREAFE
jgi:hypothetical protein